MGAVFLESVYQEALELELGFQSIPFIAQQPIQIHYKGNPLEQKYIPDFLCYDQIIVEIKAINHLSVIEEAQLLNYLKASKKPLGLLLNFDATKLEWKRMVYAHPWIRQRNHE